MSTFDPADPEYTYPHAYSSTREGAVTVTSTDGSVWALATARAVPTGFYLWGLTGQPRTFRTLVQIRSQIGIDPAEFRRGEVAENDQYLSTRPRSLPHTHSPRQDNQ